MTRQMSDALPIPTSAYPDLVAYGGADNGPVFSPVSSSSSAMTILNAAERLIASAGYAGFSMRELAEQSGLAKGTIYHYFRDKQDVYLHVVERQMIDIQNRMAEAAVGYADPVDGLHAVIRTYFSLVSQRRHGLMTTLRDSKDVQLPLQELVEKHGQGFMRPLADLVRQGVAAGIFRPVDVDMTVISLLGMMNAFVTHRLLLDQSELDQNVADHTLSLLMNGIAVEKREA